MLEKLWSVFAGWLPFRLRYWVVHHNSHGGMLVVRQRMHPGNNSLSSKYGMITLDGPFDTTDDAARSLGFWIAQYANSRRPKQRV